MPKKEIAIVIKYNFVSLPVDIWGLIWCESITKTYKCSCYPKIANTSFDFSNEVVGGGSEVIF